MLAASRLYRAVRQFAVTTPVWQDAVRYMSLPDERYDLTLVSRRVYGTPHEYLAVMAAAGLDRVDQPLNEQLLVLPTLQQLESLKAQYGYDASGPAKSVR